MSRPDVLGSEMNFRRLSDADIEALIAGEPAAGTPGPVVELVSALRSEFDATPTVGVGPVLGEFIDVVDLTTMPTETSARRTAGLGTKAAAVFGALSVKMLLGAAVAAASVGGAHALGVVDVPGLPNTTDTVPVQSPEPVNDTPVQVPAPVGQDEQDRLPVSEGPVPEPNGRAADVPEPGDGCELGRETAADNAGGATETRGNDGPPVDPCTVNQNPVDGAPDQSQADEPGRPEGVPAGPLQNVLPSRTSAGG